MYFFRIFTRALGYFFRSFSSYALRQNRVSRERDGEEKIGQKLYGRFFFLFFFGNRVCIRYSIRIHTKDGTTTWLCTSYFTRDPCQPARYRCGVLDENLAFE